jgi:CubicO group peptidase (beta-lactamase class C family)
MRKERKMKELERAVQAIECGVLVKTYQQKRPFRTVEILKRMKQQKVPGFSIVLIDQGEVAWAKGFGVQEAGSEAPVTETTIFQAASISKLVTAMVALRLVEDGQLDLDADINDALTSWKVPASKHTETYKVTLRGLLSHTAGLSNFGYPGYPYGEALPTITQVLYGKPPATSKPVRVVQPPGKGFRYSGGGFLAVQQLIEDVTGRTLTDLAREWVFNPLGMGDSTFESILPEAMQPRAATAHNRKGMPIPGRWHIYPEQAAASLWSTPTDLARLAVEVIQSRQGESNRVLSTEMTRQMLTPQISWIGLGFPIIQEDGRTKFEHPGWNEGFHSLLVGCPETGQGVVWMANGESGKSLGREVMRTLPGGFGWKRY